MAHRYLGISNDYPTGTPLVSAVGLVLAYDMETFTGGQMKDFSGLGNHGTITGAADIAGKFGRARSFVTTSDVIQTNTNIGLSPSVVSFGAWIYVRNFNNFGALIDRTQGTTWEWSSYALQTGISPNVYTEIKTVSGTTNLGVMTNLSPNTWYHVFVTYDGGLLSLYVNGTLDNSVAASGDLFYDGDSRFVVGTNLPSAVAYDGIIDEVLVFDRALSADEILALANEAPLIVNVSVSPSPANTNDDIELRVEFSGSSSGLTSYAEIGNVSKELSIDGSIGKAIFRGRDIGAGTHSVNVAAVDGVEGDKDP